MTSPFPDDFVWGVATAAHQVEGNNTHSDFWLLEHTPGTAFAEPSGDACDQWHRYREDIALLADLGFRSYRLSIEWARIEPEEGCFSRAALDHYRRLLAACHERGVIPCVTFHHFTNPLWVTADGGWESVKTADRFARYCERATRHLGDLIGRACTLNEPNLPATLAQTGVLPPDGLKRVPAVTEAARRCGSDPAHFAPFLIADPYRTRDVMLAAHLRGRDAIRSGPGAFPVGITLAIQDCVAEPGGEERLAAMRRESFEPFLEAARADDFVGVGHSPHKPDVSPDNGISVNSGLSARPTGGQHRNVYHALGYSGHGVALALLAGRVLADLYDGNHEAWRDLPFYQKRLLPIPLEPLRWVGYQAYTRATGRSPRKHG